MNATEKVIAAKESEATRLETALSNAGKTHAPRPALPANDVLHALDLICAHVAKLRVAVSLAHPKISVPSGISSVGSSANGSAASNPPLTATQKVLAAKGVSSLAELEAKRS